ncbi:serine/threonine-protein kinase [Actinomadura sp. 21ATH]|uniref:serine/threonine-protein kinase n=1 Tax=Actinomadura sp. 21ATH TaxID=1735444 RepID=UPI0035BF4CE8
MSSGGAVREWRVAGFVEVRELGAGAHGRVVLARHAESGAPVAIKYMPVAAGRAERLRREAVLLGRVDDPHVARLYRLVESAHGAAIVMEAVDGVSLKRVLERHGALAAEAALLVMKGSLLGLAAAHRVGVVHRDYKPANVVVRADGLSKLIDFGVAVVAGEGGRSGTPAYMAPEQWRGEPATPATDVYGATCVFFECLTGRRPFGGGAAELWEAHLHAAPPLDEVPEAVRELVARGMAKAPEERPGQAADLVRELEGVAVAAYGPDWETRGVRALAGAAAALASLFPLAAAVLPLGGGAAHGGAGAGAAALHDGALDVAAGANSASAAGGSASSGPAGIGAAAGPADIAGAGGTGGQASGAGIAGTKGGAGTAVAAGAAGAALLVGAGAVVVASLPSGPPSSGRPTAAGRPVMGTIATQRQTLGERRVDVRAQYVRLSGPVDPAVRERADQALRAPLDWTIQRVQPHTAAQRAACNGNSAAAMRVRIGVNGPSLVSALYTNASTLCWPADGAPPGWAVTIDVKTGRAYTATDIFRPQTLTAPGIQSLWNRMAVKGRRMWGPRGCMGEYPRRADFFPTASAGLPGLPAQDPPRVTVFLAPDRIEVNTALEGSACRSETLTAPYGKVGDLLAPGIVGKLPS